MPPQELQTRVGEATRPLEPFCVQLRPGEDPNLTVLNLPDDLGADPPSHADPYDTKLVEPGHRGVHILARIQLFLARIQFFVYGTGHA